MSASATPTEKVFKSFLAIVLATSLCPLMPVEKAQAEEAGGSSEPADTAQAANEGEGEETDLSVGALGEDNSNADLDLAVENNGTEDEGTTDDSNVALQATSDSGTPIVNWTTCGTCQWMIDSNGCLIIEPQSGETGELDDWIRSEAPWLEYKSSIASAKIKKTVIAKTTSRAFDDCKSLRSVDLSGLDASKAINMSSMFSGCSSLVSLDLSGLDTSSATGMSYMFSGCSSLSSLDLSSLDTSSVASMSYMSYMFYGCSSLRTVALGEKFSFEGAKGSRQCSLTTPEGDGLTGRWVSSADGIAYPAGEVPSGVAATYAAQREDGGEWNGSGTCVWRVDGEGCLAVKPLPGLEEGALGTWSGTPPWYGLRGSIESARFEGSVSAGTARCMFYGCSSLSSLDLSGLDTSKATDMRSMFDGCSSLRTVALGEKFSFEGGEGLPPVLPAHAGGRRADRALGELGGRGRLPCG